MRAWKAFMGHSNSHPKLWLSIYGGWAIPFWGLWRRSWRWRPTKDDNNN